MHDNGVTLLFLGAALLAGYAAHVVGARSHVPRVTLLLLIGVAWGPSGLDLTPAASWFPTLTEVALAMVGFLLGEEFVSKKSQHSKRVISLAVLITVITAGVVAASTWLAGASIELALILGGIATATAPAASLDLIRETRAAGPLTDTVLGIVAADDILGVLLFSVLLALAEALAGLGTPNGHLVHAAWEIGGAAALGLIAGLPMAFVTGRLKKGEPAALEALGFVLLVAGLASLLEVSFLLAAMVLGGTVARFAKHHTRAVHEIEGFSSPLLALFFLFAGVQLHLEALAKIGLVGLAYVAARVAGRVVGGVAGGPMLGHRPEVSRRIGLCLLPQAGVALGLALVAAERLGEVGAQVMPVVIAATVFFELVGPVSTRWMLARARETGQAQEPGG